MALLEAIFPGSYVWICGRRGGETVRWYERVLRKTRTQFVIDNEFRTRFRRINGEEIGGMHDRIERLATTEEMAAFDIEKAAKDIREKELCEEERRLKKLIDGDLFEIARRGMRYEVRAHGLAECQVRAMFAAMKGVRKAAAG